MNPEVLVDVVNTAATWVEAIVQALTLFLYKVLLPLFGIAYAYSKLTPHTGDDVFFKRWLNRLRDSKNAMENPDKE